MGLFPVGHERLARVPRNEMEDALSEILCSVIPIQHNEKTNTVRMAGEWIPTHSRLPPSDIDPFMLLIFTFALLDMKMFRIELSGFICVILRLRIAGRSVSCVAD